MKTLKNNQKYVVIPLFLFVFGAPLAFIYSITTAAMFNLLISSMSFWTLLLLAALVAITAYIRYVNEQSLTEGTSYFVVSILGLMLMAAAEITLGNFFANTSPSTVTQSGLKTPLEAIQATTIETRAIVVQILTAALVVFPCLYYVVKTAENIDKPKVEQ